MDKYDQETLKQITTQFPKDKSIQFLARLLKEERIEKGKIESENSELKYELNKLKIEYNNILKLSRKARKNIPRLDTELQQELKEKLFKAETTVNRYRKDKDYLITKNIQLQNQLDGLKPPVG